jgi:hypothetical protein
MSKKRNNTPGWAQKSEYLQTVDVAFTDKKQSLNPDELDRVVKQHGVPVRIYRSMYCPNVKTVDAAEHQIDCKLCNGSGIIDIKPLESTAYFHSNSFNPKIGPEGNHDGNVLMATFLRGIELQYFTLVELDIPDVFYQRVKRQVTSIDILKYPALQINAVVDSRGKEYYEGNDFRLDPNGSISWKTGKGPSKNDIYSVHYHTKVQFRATKAIHKNRFLNLKTKSDQIKIVKANEAWEMTREYLVRRSSILGEFLPQNDIEDN